jgi:hypothetical protein
MHPNRGCYRKESEDEDPYKHVESKVFNELEKTPENHVKDYCEQKGG